MDIRLVKGEEIDKIKWNSCVHYAVNGNIFGYMWYLDHVAKDWDALVEGDYESVFPLVWRSRFWGGKKLYQPDLMRELGVYSINILSQKRIGAFLEAIPEEYKRVDIVLNEQNRPPEQTPYAVEKQINHQLFLNRTYEELAMDFTPEIKEEIALAEDANLLPASNLKPEKIADFFKKHTPVRKGIDQQFHALQRVMYNVLHRGWGFSSGITNAEGDLLAVNFFIYSHRKALSLVPVESKAGREVGALAHLYHYFIRSHADRPIILDFNTVNGQEALALGFGARENQYYRVRR